jgi:hypothetical protein
MKQENKEGKGKYNEDTVHWPVFIKHRHTKMSTNHQNLEIPSKHKLLRKLIL